jgi:hypothetical protein
MPSQDPDTLSTRRVGCLNCSRSICHCASRVVLDVRVWDEKIVRDHPEVTSYKDNALQAVSAPDHVEPDPGSADRKGFYLRGVGPSRWLLVVVSYEQKPARIISVFANRKDPKTWSA